MGLVVKLPPPVQLSRSGATTVAVDAGGGLTVGYDSLDWAAGDPYRVDAPAQPTVAAAISRGPSQEAPPDREAVRSVEPVAVEPLLEELPVTAPAPAATTATGSSTAADSDAGTESSTAAEPDAGTESTAATDSASEAADAGATTEATDPAPETEDGHDREATADD